MPAKAQHPGPIRASRQSFADGNAGFGLTVFAGSAHAAVSGGSAKLSDAALAGAVVALAGLWVALDALAEEVLTRIIWVVVGAGLSIFALALPYAPLAGMIGLTVFVGAVFGVSAFTYIRNGGSRTSHAPRKDQVLGKSVSHSRSRLAL